MELEPLSLDDLEKTGATRFGRRIVRVVAVYDDGRRVAMDLPNPALEPANLTVMQASVVQAVDEMRVGDVLSFEEIAEKAGYANGEGLRMFVRTLSEAGKLEKVHRGWKRR